MPPDTLFSFRTFARLSALLFLLTSFRARSVEVPPASWATFITGTNQLVLAPKLLANPTGGFYFYSAGDRLLIKFNSDNSVGWDVRYERGFNDINEIAQLDVLDNGDVIAIVSANPNPRLFGQQFSAYGTYLVQLRAADGTPVFIGDCENCALTAVRSRPGGGYFVAGYNWGTARIGSNELPLPSPRVFLAQISNGVDWTLDGGSGVNAADYRIEAIRTSGIGVNLRVFAAGNAPGPWTFAGKLITQSGAYLLTAGSAGQALNAQVIAPNASFAALEATPTGRLHFGADSATQHIVRRIEADGSLNWTSALTNLMRIAAIAASDEPFVIGTLNGAIRFSATTALDASGNIKWQRIEATRDVNEGSSIAVLSDGRLAITGSAHCGGIYIDDFFLSDSTQTDLANYGAFVATLETRVNAAPVMRVQPRDQKFALRGETITLHTEVFSPTGATITWYKDGNVITNQTSSDLILPAAQAPDSGTYFLEARNAAGATRSKFVEVIVNTVTPTTVPGTGAAAALDSPRSPIVLPDGSIVIADPGKNVIKRVASNGVMTFAGSGQPGLNNGSPQEALFSSPSGLAVETRYSVPIVYVADRGNNRVRRIRFSATTGEATSVDQADYIFPSVGAVAAIEGLSYFVAASGQSNGLWICEGLPLTELAGSYTNSAIAAVGLDLRGNLYMADSAVHEIRRRTPAGEIQHIATIADPTGIAVDDAENVFVTDRATHTIQKISRSGIVTPLVSEGLLNAPEGLCFRGNSLIVADTGNHSLREIKFEPAQTVVTGTARITVTVGTFLRIGVSGNISEQYAIESTSHIGTAAIWQFEGTVSIGQVTSDALIPKPATTRFYRARRIQ